MCKLSVIFGTVAWFWCSEKVYSFAKRLEGTLNQIQLHCFEMMMDLEGQQHLRDHVFHGMRKHIFNSAWYLYSIPGILNSQLMVASQKAESKSEETQDHKRAMAIVTTKPVYGMAKLKQQITKLMAALTQTGWGNGHTITLSSPEECGYGCGCSGRGSNSHSDSHNSGGGSGQTTQAQGLPMEHVEEGTVSQSGEQVNWGPSVSRESAAGHCDSPLSSVTGARCRATWPECPTLASTLNQPRRNQENAAHPLASVSYQGTNRPLTFTPSPRPRLTNMKAAKQQDMHDMNQAVPFLNLDPITHLMGWSNKELIIING